MKHTKNCQQTNKQKDDEESQERGNKSEC
jgi:hypothetical protein